MKRKQCFLLSATLVATLTLKAQQTTQPITPAPQAQVGCIAAPPKPPAPKGFHLTIPKTLRTVIDKQRSKVEDTIGVHVPTPEEIAKRAQTAGCPQPTPVQTK